MKKENPSVEIRFRHLNLNNNDIGLIFLCRDEARSVAELSRGLGIAQKNVIVRIPKLLEKKLIKVKRLGRGRKTFVSAAQEHPQHLTIVFWAWFKIKSNQLLSSDKRQEFLDDLNGLLTK